MNAKELLTLDEALNYLNEGNSSNLSDKQIKYINEALNNKYSKILAKLRQNCKKFMSNTLKSKCNDGFIDFRYDKYYDEFQLCFLSFTNYTYRSNESDKKSLIEEMKKDLDSFSKSFSSEMKNIFKDELSFYFGDPDCGLYSISEFIKFMNKCIEYYKEAPSNDIMLFIICKNYSKYIPTELELNSSENKKYIAIYEKFLKFLKSPSTMPNGLWCGHISDICKIMGISSVKLNEIVSDNFKSGKKFKLDANNFEDSYYAKTHISQLGTCYMIDNFSDCDYLIYSDTKKHLYLINYEHSNIISFFDSNEYQYSSQEFAEKIFLKDTADIKKLFNKYNEENNIEL